MQLSIYNHRVKYEFIILNTGGQLLPSIKMTGCKNNAFCSSLNYEIMLLSVTTWKKSSLYIPDDPWSTHKHINKRLYIFTPIDNINNLPAPRIHIKLLRGFVVKLKKQTLHI